MKKIILGTIAFIALTTSLKAQQDAMFTHYMYNTLWLNPAYAGTRDAFTITAIHRSQWVGFEGAPTDQTLTMHSPILKGKMGVGLSVLNDKIGPTKSTFLALDLDYQIKINSKSKLSFGLKGLVNFYSVNLNRLSLENQNDNAFSENINRILPNSGAGIYYYRERFYAGISVPKLMENKIKSSSQSIRKMWTLSLKCMQRFSLKQNLLKKWGKPNLVTINSLWKHWTTAITDDVQQNTISASDVFIGKERRGARRDKGLSQISRPLTASLQQRLS